MEILLDKINDTEALIKITLNEDDYQNSVEEKIKDYSKKANIKGFRPGKVPAGMIRKMYGKSILVDEINHMLSHKLQDYLRESDLQILGEPIPNFEKANSIDWDNQKDFEFEYNIGFAEDFDIAVDKKIKVEKATIKVDDKVIDETVDNLKNQFGESINPDTAEEGDSVYGKLTSGEVEVSALIELSKLKKTPLKKFIGAKQGDKIPVEAKHFDDDQYFITLLGEQENLEELSKSKFEFELDKVNRVQPAEVNEELFKKTFPNEEVTTEEDFRSKISDIVSENYNREADFLFNQKIREKLIEKAKINLPDDFLKQWLMRSNEGLTEDSLANEYKHYADELMWSLIKNKLMKDQEIKVEHEDVVNAAKDQIRAQFASSGMVGDQFESSMDAFADNYLKGENGDNYMKVHNQVQTEKVLAYIKENISSKEKEVSLDEFRKL